jgi:hypothetical protein
MFPLRASLCAAALALLAAAGRAEMLSIALHAGQPAEVVLESPVDDSNYQDPRGYLHHGASTRALVQRLTLTNTGTVPLTGPLLVVNGRDWSTPEALRKSLALPAEPRALMPRLFAFWRDQHSHADSDCESGKEPLALLNFWGYSLCGDTTAALARLATSSGVPARKIPLNGHVAAEYFYDDAWHIFDSDQDVSYLRLDNRTLASAADLRADPLLARRTKVLGRYAPVEPAAMAFNTALHEYLEPKEQKPVKSKTPPAPVRAETLFPGEQMIIHAAEAPEVAVGRTDLKRWGDVRQSALRVIEWVINPAARRNASGQVVVTTGYPILRAVNHTTGEELTPPAGQATFEIALQPRAFTDHISVYCQRTRSSLPFLSKGRNAVLLAAAESQGAAKLEVEWEKPADVIVPVATPELVNATPTFRIQTQPDADRLWWQISATEDFAYVPPNFDAVIYTVKELTFDPLTATFFNPAQSYYLRVKACREGVWGEWSLPFAFRVEKPARPAPATVSEVSNRLRLSWADAGAGTEYLVFGSNRLDFVPEPFAAEEIVKMREQKVEQSRPNQNLVAVVSKPEADLEPAFRFYRVIARRGGVLSLPGDLITTPAALAAKLPPALVLQVRWRRVADSDEYLATEMPLR